MENTPDVFICLNMIIKNESKTILRLFDSIIDCVDVIVLSDTGSTDSTKEIITEYQLRRHPDKKIHFLPDIPFTNFGFNRTYSLHGCISLLRTNYAEEIKNNKSYILLLDADMIFKQTGKLSLKEYISHATATTTADVMYMFQGSAHFYYCNARMISASLWDTCKYIGATHEYIHLTDNKTTHSIMREDFFIEDIGDGGSKTCKIKRDIQLLTDGLVDEPTNERYMFYLACTLQDDQQYNEAIEMYNKRITAGGWFEEVWYSYYKIGHCYMSLHKPEYAIDSWLNALQYSTYRIENIYEIVKYYRCENKPVLGFHFYMIAKNILQSRGQNDNILFFKNSVYSYLLDFEFTILINYYNPFHIHVLDEYMKLFNNPLVDNSTRGCILYNIQFEVMQLIDFHYHHEIHDTLTKITQDIIIHHTPPDFKHSTPTILYNAKEGILFLNIRFVNYVIDENGNYIQRQNICTKNYFVKINVRCGNILLSQWLHYDVAADAPTNAHTAGYIGLEDIRLSYTYIAKPDPFTNDSTDEHMIVLYNCNRGLSNTGKITIECGYIENGATTHSHLFVENELDVEKNWVCFLDSRNKCKFIYSWYQNGYIIIGDKSKHGGGPGGGPGGGFVKTHSIETPHFFMNLRGSSNGIYIENEIWFICHVVDYGKRRRYYHCFVAIDAMTFDIIYYSHLWTFEKKPVEYCVSFIYLESSPAAAPSCIIGYSTNDSSTSYIHIPFSKIKELCINKKHS